ncbi:beta strand repeat-containing protein [Clostridium saccharoperbutylacetonicum]|uniref:beta strand repeat-containing protein n=1 Tax=Clostridium saccharoperbutylacetonicum TaxID=36745 RepID=UPI000983FECB|nr:InlB B-repeat-containing protein [Clostridium saccharoperbutylacetonicum]AQR94497.1 internalin-A precursor [Clostridium saccharoperbutylacetonicum]
MRNGIRKFKLVSVILGVVIFIMFSQNENAVALAYDGTVNFGTTASTLGTTSTPGDTITASDVLSTGLDFIGSNGTSTSTTLRIFSAGGNAGGYFRMSGVSGMTINYLEIRAREGIFDLPSLYLNPVNGGSTSYNIQALDSSFQLTGSIITSSMTPSTWTLVNTNFIGIAGFRITPANGNMIGVDDIFIQNPRLASSTYNVMYNGNGNTGGTVPTDSTSYTSGTIVTAASNSGNLVKTGYTFAGWNTAANGSGTDYAAGSGTFSIAANTTLYAKWTPVPTTYTVTYNGNGNTGGTVPTDSTSYTSGTTVTAASNSGNLVKTGYTFAGWNTAANGSGTDYAAGSGTFSIAANTTLYAKWTAVPTTYTVTYDGNGNTGGTVPTDSTDDIFIQNPRLASSTYNVMYNGNGNTGGTVPTDSTSYTSGTIVTAASNSGNLVKTGYTFAGWNTAANGSGTDYAAGSGTFSIAANTTLYAKWTPVPTTYTVTYNGNGNTGGTVPTDSTSYTSGTTVTAASNSGNLVKTGYTFAGWNTAANGSGTDYAAGSGTFSIAANTTLYAKWTAVPTTYTVTYDGNGNTGGTVPTDSTSYTGGQTVTAASNSGSLVKTGYTFAGWNTAANGSGTDYAVGSGTFSIVANTTLYAKWTAVPTTYTVTYDGNGNTGGTVPTDSASYTSGQTVTAASNSGNLVKTGYTFAGWNTLANGSGTDYAAGSGTFSIAANTTLYAKWTPVSTYTATLSQTGTHTFTGATVGYTSISPRTITVTNTGTGSLTGLGEH